MPSIADIPEELLNCNEKPAFLLWLLNLPTDNMTKKELLFLWAKYTGCPITLVDMTIVFGQETMNDGL